MDLNFLGILLSLSGSPKEERCKVTCSVHLVLFKAQSVGYDRLCLLPHPEKDSQILTQLSWEGHFTIISYKDIIKGLLKCS